jgi:hypothetical protein
MMRYVASWLDLVLLGRLDLVVIVTLVLPYLLLLLVDGTGSKGIGRA